MQIQPVILLIIFISYFELIILLVNAHQTIHHRHYKRQIKEKSINKKEKIDFCTEPKDLENQMLGWWNKNDAYEEGDYSSKSSDEKKINQLYDSGSTENDLNNVKLEDICMQPPKKNIDSSIMQRSLCPWQWKLNYDKKRKPKFISEAKCLCRKSRGLSGSYCMPIKRKFSVLKRADCNPITRKYEYVKEVEIITVGCHSVLPRSQRALPLSAFYNNNRHQIEVK